MTALSVLVVMEQSTFDSAQEQGLFGGPPHSEQCPRSWQGSACHVCWPTASVRVDRGETVRSRLALKRLLQKAAPPTPHTHLSRQRESRTHPVGCVAQSRWSLWSALRLSYSWTRVSHTCGPQAALLSGMFLLEGHLLCWTAEQMTRASGIQELLAPRLGQHLQPVGLAWPLATIAQPQPPAAICSSADLCAPQNVWLIKTIMAHTRGYSFPAKVAELS